MLKDFSEAQINVVRVAESTWGIIQKADETFDFEWLDLFLDDVESFDMKAILGTSTYLLY